MAKPAIKNSERHELSGGHLLHNVAGEPPKLKAIWSFVPSNY